MGAQSILLVSQENYAQEFQKQLLRYSDNYYINKHYKVGDGVDADKLKHAMIFNSLLCTDSCELSDYIMKKIEGKLEDKKRCKRKITPEKLECKDKDRILKECCPEKWSKNEW